MKVIKIKYKNDYFNLLVDSDFNPPTNNIFRNKRGYFWFRVDGRITYVHRWVMNVTSKEEQVDHVDNDKSNNTRENLRICTHTQNQQNRKNKGFRKCLKSGKYTTRLRINKREIHLGSYDTPEEAQQVYRKAHAEAFGEFSPYYEYYSGITKEETNELS